MMSIRTIVVASKHQVHCDLGGEAAILNLESGIYYGLNSVGSFVWNSIQSPQRIGDVCATMVKEFEVELENCERDVLELLREMLEQGLIEVCDAT